MLRVARGLGTG